MFAHTHTHIYNKQKQRPLVIQINRHIKDSKAYEKHKRECKKIGKIIGIL